MLPFRMEIAAQPRTAGPGESRRLAAHGALRAELLWTLVYPERRSRRHLSPAERTV